MNNRVFNVRKSSGYLATIAFHILCIAGMGFAQTTAFTYQGKLIDNGAPASGTYDLTFKLYDTVTVGSGVQQGTTLSMTNVTVSGGVFTVALDFGACASCFNGEARFLEISVKPSNGSTFTTLSPRQQLTATPYALKSVSATTADDLSVTCVSCVTSSQIESVQGSQISGTISGSQINGEIPVASVPAGSNNYIQNQNGGIQPGDFKINGRGAFGGRVGIGTYAPTAALHVVGSDILFESFSVGAPQFPRLTMNFPFAAANERRWQHYVSNDSFISAAVNDGNFEGAQGRWLQVIRVGSIIDRVTFPNGKVGIGTFSPQTALHVVGQDVRVESAVSGSIPRFSLVYPFAPTDSKKWQNSTTGQSLFFNAVNDAENQATTWLQVNRLNGTALISSVEFPSSFVRINQLASGSTALCRDNTNQIAFCSSSIRYKQNIQNYQPGLSLIKKLRPVSFNWKADNMVDMGLLAEEVAEVEPLLVTHNDKGEIEGVKYDRVAVVLLNAVKEQQAQITAQQAQLKQQAQQMQNQLREIAILKRLYCLQQPKAEMCKSTARTVSATKKFHSVMHKR
jgi:hypothetical protein